MNVQQMNLINSSTAAHRGKTVFAHSRFWAALRQFPRRKSSRSVLRLPTHSLDLWCWSIMRRGAEARQEEGSARGAGFEGR